MIYISGAGCGEVSLLTLKAKQVIQRADCILYDRLINEDILSLAPSSCVMIYVGKQQHNHTMSQQDLNQLLFEMGQQYHCVIRLKGGDPYVFGRGGEEALYLHEHDMPFHIIPGISSCLGVGSYAGIPLTHRGIAQGFRVMSAHSGNDEIIDLDYASMAHTEDTLVFLMGLAHVGEIVERLLQAHMDPQTPIALISNGASYSQKVVTRTLATLHKEDVQDMVSPTIIIIGKTVALRDQLAFYEQKPLFHKHYMVASLQREDTLYWQFEEQGATLTTCVCGEPKTIAQALENVNLSRYSYLVFTSKHAIDSFFACMFQKGLDARSLAHMTLCAIGENSASHALRYGVQCDMVPHTSDSKGLVHMLKSHLKSSDNVLILKADNQNTTLEKGLQPMCQVDVVATYEIITKPYTLPNELPQAILFTCGYVVESVLQQLHNKQAYLQIPVYALGTHTRDCLMQHGFQHVVVLPHADKQAFFDQMMKEEEHVSR